MDISKVTDLKELKALAFDALQAIEVQQTNLRIVQQRIAELEELEQEKKK
jgi:hypothetical protein